MKLGICLPHYGRPIEVGRLLEVARRAEDRGLDSVWVTDHVIVPEQANVIYREDMLDPLAVLPWLAGVTHRVALGTSVVILPYRSPIPVAKLLASVDVLSGGRLIVGAAIGWLEGEFETLGLRFKERASRSDEALELMRTLWTQAHPRIHTKRHRVHDVVASPMPLQKPRPPLYIGGASDGAYRRVARLGDGWHASSMDHDAFRQGAESVRRGRGRQARRDPGDRAEVPQNPLGVRRLEQDARRGCLAGGRAVQLARANEYLHARGGLVVRELAPTERAAATVASQIPADQEWTRRVSQPSKRRRETEDLHRHELEDHQSRRHVECRIGHDRVRPVEHPRDSAGRHQDVVGVKIAVADGARLRARRTVSDEPFDPGRKPAEPATRGAIGQMREVSVEREGLGLEAFASDRPQERHGIEIVKTRLEIGDHTRHDAEADFRQRLA